MDAEYGAMMAGEAMDRTSAAKCIDPFYAQRQAAAASLHIRTQEPRLMALSNRLSVLNERAYEARKRLEGELDRIVGGRAETAVNGSSVPGRGPDAVGMLETAVDSLEGTISDIMDHVGRLSGL